MPDHIGSIERTASKGHMLGNYMYILLSRWKVIHVDNYIYNSRTNDEYLFHNRKLLLLSVHLNHSDPLYYSDQPADIKADMRNPLRKTTSSVYHRVMNSERGKYNK